MNPAMSLPIESPALFPERLFHVGVIVDDLTDGMAQWAALLGVCWRQPFAGVSEVHVGDTFSEEPFAAVYSVDGPLHVELIPARPDTIWGERGLHHLGYWSSDIATDCARLVDGGAEVEAVMKRDGTVLAAYLRIGTSRIELNDSGARDRLIGSDR
jgi:hypothetical protein